MPCLSHAKNRGKKIRKKHAERKILCFLGFVFKQLQQQQEYQFIQIVVFRLGFGFFFRT